MIHKPAIRSTVHQECQEDRYDTYTDAAPVLRILNRKGKPAQMAVTCPHCGGWHIVLRSEAMAQPTGAPHHVAAS